MAVPPIQSNPQPPAPAIAAGFTKLVLADEFDDPNTVGALNAGKYWNAVAPAGGSERNAGSSVSVASSVLTIAPSATLHNNHVDVESYYIDDPNPAAPYKYLYGFFEIRALTTNFSAIWLWASNASKWPGGSPVVTAGDPSTWFGEIDIQETYDNTSANLNAVHSTLHRNTQSYGGVADVVDGTTYTPGGAVQQNFRTYGCLWQPNSIKVYYEGSTTPFHTFDVTNSPSLRQPMEIILSSYASMGGAANVLPIQTKVDYVRVWQSGKGQQGAMMHRMR